jgi:hypothetical protein
VNNRLKFKGELATTAMGILPHEEMDEALSLALSVDIPFWPQLPRVSFYEDMYVQAMEGFPGAIVDEEHRRIYVDTEKFYEDIPGYLDREGEEETFRMSEKFSSVYHRFLTRDLKQYKAIRGQVISPVSLTLKIVDENGKPIVYNDEIRQVAFSFIRNKVNAQYRELKVRNERAFVWVDDPGLEFVFSAMSGYDNIKAKNELDEFFSTIEGPRGLHLCGRPDWDFLLSLDIEILSFNSFGFGDIFVTYDRVKDFLQQGRIISWGIVPTYFEEFSREDVDTVASRLLNMWRVLEEKGVPRETIFANGILAPATCNLLNPDKTTTVEKSFQLLQELSVHLRETYLQ